MRPRLSAALRSRPPASKTGSGRRERPAPSCRATPAGSPRRGPRAALQPGRGLPAGARRRRGSAPRAPCRAGPLRAASRATSRAAGEPAPVQAWGKGYPSVGSWKPVCGLGWGYSSAPGSLLSRNRRAAQPSVHPYTRCATNTLPAPRTVLVRGRQDIHCREPAFVAGKPDHGTKQGRGASALEACGHQRRVERPAAHPVAEMGGEGEGLLARRRQRGEQRADNLLRRLAVNQAGRPRCPEDGGRRRRRRCSSGRSADRPVQEPHGFAFRPHSGSCPSTALTRRGPRQPTALPVSSRRRPH